MIDRIDHLVYATPDVEASVADLERLLGVRASIGGQHPGRGTRNAVIAIGRESYLEIIGPDHTQAPPVAPRWFGIDSLTAPQLVTWAAHGTELTTLVNDAAQRGVRLGAVSEGRRQRADGVLLTWQVTEPGALLGDVVIPFFIDWGSSPHPSSTAVAGPRLVGLRGEHPDPARMEDVFSVLGIAMSIGASSSPGLVATLQTADGPVELR